MEIFPGITRNPNVRFGKPCITGTRIYVATVVGLIASGETVETVATEYGDDHERHEEQQAGHGPQDLRGRLRHGLVNDAWQAVACFRD
jgi:hypothetical protein